MKDPVKRKSGAWKLLLIAALLAAVCAAVLLVPRSGEELQQTEPTTPVDENVIPIGMGLRILKIGSYAGIYMEDGTDETVSGVMMLVLENTAEQDLQLARVEIDYPDFTAHFEVTNLPAGEKVVLLERSRLPATEESYLQIRSQNVLFFPEPMDLREDVLEITGGKGWLDVRNISDSELPGGFYVYYKNSATDLLYGGITYRVRVGEAIGPGETVRLMTGHYSEGNSRLMMVDLPAA